ncbi:MAG: DUF512 domain-containing protein [Candidatus Heteroscillospira sp.]
MSSVITGIERQSPLFDKVSVGDTLLKINGQEITDVLDYKFYAYDSRLSLLLRRPDGEEYTLTAEKEEGADLGLEFETYLMDKARSCSNRCLFCFVDQLPRGLRRTLYFKDDDARLSFLTGNYITLTNLSQREIQRICDLRISPINVSVHATEPALRAKLLGNPRGAEGMDIIRRFADAGITMNCQIVCCPGLNDGEALRRSMEELSPLYPAVNSVSIVPVGLTCHRKGLAELRPFERGEAAAVIDLAEEMGAGFMEEYGSRIFFCSDELYLAAGRSLPDYDFYEGFPQLENGVGMLRLLEWEFMDELDYTEPDSGSGESFTIATGVSAAPFLEKLMLTAAEKCGKLKGEVRPIVNDFFGHTINVAGLITGRDLIAQLKDKKLGGRLLIPQNMLRHGEGVFLDDVTLEDVSRALNVPVIPVMQDGSALLRAMLGEQTPI